MKKKHGSFFGFAVMIIAAIFAFTGCPQSTDGNSEPTTPQSATYISADTSGNRYSLTVTENTNRSARYAAQTGDRFALKIELYNDGNYSLALNYSGTIGSAESSGTTITLSITVNAQQLNITIVGANMTVITTPSGTGNIPLDDPDATLPVPGTVTPVSPPTDPDPPDPNADGTTRETAIMLADGVWADGAISETVQERWYKFNADEFYTQYNVWWKDNNADNSGTTDIKVSSYRGTSGTVTDNGVDSGWTNPGFRIYQYSGIAYLKIEGYGASDTGTYSICVTSGLARPGPVANKTSYSVSANGSSLTPTTALTFTFSQAVNSLSESYISLADAAIWGNAILTPSAGNTVWTLSGLTVKYTGRAYVTVTQTNVDTAGHMVKVYAADATAGDGSTRETAITLADDEWADGYLYAGGEKWYKFNAEEFYTQYNVWWKDNDADNSGTTDIKVSSYWGTSGTVTDNGVDSGWNNPGFRIYQYSGTVYLKIEGYGASDTGTYSICVTSGLARPGPVANKTSYSVSANGSSLAPTTALTFTFSQAVNSLSATYLSLAEAASLGSATFTSSENYTVWTVSGLTIKYTGRTYVTVTATNVDTAGHMVKVYATNANAGDDGSTRETAIPLAAAQWADGYLYAGGEKWYKIDAAGGTNFFIWWKDNDAENSGTTDIAVSDFMDASSSVSNARVDSGWNNPGITVNSKSSGTIYLKVEGYGAHNTGTYSIGYNTTATSP